MRGLYFNLSKWDGSDWFMFDDEDMGFVVVTRRTIDLLRSIKATGWYSIPVLKFEC